MADYQRIDSAGEEPVNLPQNTMAILRNRMRDMIFQTDQNLDNSFPSQALSASSPYKKPVFMVNDMKSTYINIKKSFEYVGDNSTFQKRITLILVFNWIAFSFMVNSMAYFFRAPNFACKLIPLTNIYIPCSQIVACKLPKDDFLILKNDDEDSFFHFNQLSIVEEFQLYCDQIDEVSWAQSMFFVGSFISGFLLSYISERIGRRPVLLIAHTSSILAIVGCAIAPSFQIFIFCYFLAGFFMFGFETSIYIYIGQISAIRFRTISINFLTMVWAGTPIFLPFLSLIPTWRICFMLFGGIWLCTLPFVYRFFLESPRFLLSKKCYEQVRSIFQQISITNKRPPYAFNLTQQIDNQNETFITFAQENNEMKSSRQNSKKGLLKIDNVSEHRSSEGKSEVKIRQYGFFDLFRYPSIKKPTLILMYWWMFRFFMYFGLNLALESVLQSGFVLTMAISAGALAQVIGSFGMPIMTTCFFNRYKLDIMGKSLAMITVCCCIMWFTQIGSDCDIFKKNKPFCMEMGFMILLVIFIKFFNSVFFTGLIVYGSEVYPTVVRSLGYGFTFTFGRIGTFIVPFYINYMRANIVNKNSLCFLAPFSLVAYFFCTCMPKTELEGMRETIKEEEDEANNIEMVRMMRNPHNDPSSKAPQIHAHPI